MHLRNCSDEGRRCALYAGGLGEGGLSLTNEMDAEITRIKRRVRKRYKALRKELDNTKELVWNRTFAQDVRLSKMHVAVDAQRKEMSEMKEQMDALLQQVAEMKAEIDELNSARKAEREVFETLRDALVKHFP